jgi:hypothetical protein
MKSTIFTSILVCAVASALQLSAVNIPVVNPSFDDLRGTDTNHFEPSGLLRTNHFAVRRSMPPWWTNECYVTPCPVPGWKISEPPAPQYVTTGTHRYTPYSFPTADPNSMCLFLNASAPPSFASQVLCHVLTPGIYTLSVNVGRRTESTDAGAYLVELRAGGVVIAQDYNSQPREPGTFVTSACAAVIPTNHPCLGTHLEIRLYGSPSTLHLSQISYDNVRLEGPSGPCLTICEAVEIAWASETNKLYQILWSSNPTSTVWTPVEIPTPWGSNTNLVSGNGTRVSVLDSVFEREQRYYRLVELP